MKIIAPSYYRDFHCIAGKCLHSCCKGWEIDIDEESMAKYREIPGKTGDALRSRIVTEETEDGIIHHFALESEERCPFLNKENLCDLIIEFGEDNLCQICRDHPRFRNFWTGRTEIGLGIACEEAARIILENPDRVELEVLEEDGCKEEIPEEESAILALRDELTAILQDRSMAADERILTILECCSLPTEGIVFEGSEPHETMCEQLAVYLLYRHLADGLYDGKLAERILFVAESYRRVRNDWAKLSPDDLTGRIEIARKFSEEIEYDTDTWSN